jgi:hypothetical protein
MRYAFACGLHVTTPIQYDTICVVLTLINSRWECFKVFTFKILNLIVLFAVERMFTNSNDDTRCALESEGDQFVILVLTDIAVLLTSRHSRVIDYHPGCLLLLIFILVRLPSACMT